MNLVSIPAEYLVLTAGAFFTLGYLVINQKILRVLIGVGTCFYLWYYFVAADQPLWEAIATSAAMLVANLLGLAGLILRDSPIMIPREHREIYKRFKDVPPGDFRMLMRLGERRVLTEKEQLTIEGAPLDRLYYVVSGVLDIEKRGSRFKMPGGVFVGEVAFLTRLKSSATTTLPAGAEVLVWDVDLLRRKARRKPRFLMALEAMISRDLAVKVALAVAPQQTMDTSAAEALQAEVAQMPRSVSTVG